MSKLKILIGGNIGLYPYGGATWDYLQYPVGFKNLGHDVYYIEDTRQYPVFQDPGEDWTDSSFNVNYLESVMNRFGLKDKWAYRDEASGKSFGMSEKKIIDLCNSADIFINISCSTFTRDEYLKIPVRILIDSDPMFTQIQYAKETANDSISEFWSTKTMIENHNYLFTFGENINAEDSIIPKFGFEWIPTRQPICLDFWENKNDVTKNGYTTVMNWSIRNPLVYNNQTWGQKDVEFLKYKNTPALVTGLKFNAVINSPVVEGQTGPDIAEFQSVGWTIHDTYQVSNMNSYRDFILESKGEFSVAKETYVKSRSGWFSCRSACYLAASRPVITQDTGWSNYIPSGQGLFAFTDIHSAVDALREVDSNYKLHQNAAREIAHEYFDYRIVLENMLSKIC
jgi:hypothetical protein